MTTVNQLPNVLQQLFETEANRLGRETGFIERQREWSGAQFAQTLVFGWMENPNASLSQLQQMALTCGCQVSVKNIATRLRESEASRFLQRLLETGLTLAQTGAEEAPARPLAFTEVVLLDSTQISLPQAFQPTWPGGGNQNQARAGMKIQTTYGWQHGHLHFSLHPAVTNDRKLLRIRLPVGALVVHDSGFVSVAQCRHVEEQAAYWLARVSAQMGIVDADGRYATLHTFLQQAQADVIDHWVGLTHQRHPVRLLARRLPPPVVEARQARLRADCQRRSGRPPTEAMLALCAWCVLATNAPLDRLSADQAFSLYRSRWQIELLFKLWKQHGALDEWRTNDPQRIATEVYAKLLMLLVQHWLLVETCWHFNDRSLLKAVRWLRRHLLTLIPLLADPPALQAFLHRLARGMVACRIARRRKRLACFQLMEACFDLA